VLVIASAPAWAVWLALGLWGVAIVVGVLAAVMARRAWRQFSPYLAMLGLSAISPHEAAAPEPEPVDGGCVHLAWVNQGDVRVCLQCGHSVPL
jgi:hypothetical protein